MQMFNGEQLQEKWAPLLDADSAVSYTHLRAHET